MGFGVNFAFRGGHFCPGPRQNKDFLLEYTLESIQYTVYTHGPDSSNNFRQTGGEDGENKRDDKSA